MSYYLINKNPIFITAKKHKLLFDIVTKDLTGLYKIGAAMAGTKESIEADNLMFKLVKNKFADDQSKFATDWYYFELHGKDAQEEAWDLLYDFCHYHGYSYLSDIRDISTKVIADYNGELYSYPMGSIFSLNHFVKPYKWWWYFTRHMKGRNIRVTIDTSKIKRISGSLTEFIIIFDNYRITCGHNLEISPL